MSYGSKPNEVRHDKAALLAEEHVVQRVQSLGYTADLNSEEVNQLTDINVVEVVDAAPSVSLTIDVNEFGSINFLNELAGYNNSFDNTNTNDGTVTHEDFGEVATDFMVAIQEGSSDTARSLWFNNCFIDSISGTYQVDGFASESISMSGSAQTWFLNDWARMNIITPAYVSTTVLDMTGVSLADPVVLTEDGVQLASTYWVVGGDKDITASGGFVFSSTKRYRALAYKLSSSFPAITDDPSSPVGGVKEGEIELIMWDSGLVSEPGIGTAGTASTKALRVQTVDYEIAFDREDLKQLYTGTYYKGLNAINVTGTVSAIDSDLEMWALGAGKYNDWATGASDVTTISLADFQSMDRIQMRIDIFNTKDHLFHNSGTLLKQIYLVDGKVTSVGDSRDVPGRGTQNFDIQFKTAAFHGTGAVGR